MRRCSGWRSNRVSLELADTLAADGQFAGANHVRITAVGDNSIGTLRGVADAVFT
jgi:hypothetical protein